MNKLFRNMFIFLLIIIFIIGFSDSYHSLSIDNLAYVLAIGIDVATDNNLEVSFQFSTPVSASESGTSGNPKKILNTVNASSLSSAINLINSYLGKQINMSHCKVIIFSEEIAAQGISEEIYTLFNDSQVRPSANIVVSKCSAKSFIEQTQPELETLISKYYETFTNSSQYTGFKPDSTIGDFFFSLTCETCEPCAILGGVQLDTPPNNSDPEYEKDSTSKANSSSITGQNGAETIGIAVFKSDKLVGELNAIETIAHLNTQNKVDRFLISIPDPIHSNSYLDIYISPTQKAKIEVDTSTQSPYAKLTFEFDGRIYSMSENSKYLSPDVIDSISESCNSYLESIFLDYLYKTSKEFKSDISNIGTHALCNFFTIDEFKSYNWPETYKNTFFDVEVKTSVQSAMLITET